MSSGRDDRRNGAVIRLPGASRWETAGQDEGVWRDMWTIGRTSRVEYFAWLHWSVASGAQQRAVYYSIKIQVHVVLVFVVRRRGWWLRGPRGGLLHAYMAVD
jgi:hypothetical protein